MEIAITLSAKLSRILAGTLEWASLPWQRDPSEVSRG